MAPPSTPHRFPTEEMFDTLIKIDVGDDSENREMRSFEVYKGVLCFYSEYFNVALNNDSYTETRDRRVKLPFEGPQVFALFKKWIHTRCFYQSTLAPSEFLPFDMIAALWIFGDSHEVPLQQNVTADLMLEKMKDTRTFPDIDDLCNIYHNTIDSSSLRLLIGDVFQALSGRELVWDDVVSFVQSNAEQGTDVELVSSGRKLKHGQLRAWSRSCKYHVHEDNVSCSA